MSCLKEIRSDFSRYIATGARSRIKIILFNQSFFFTSVFRVNTWLYAITRTVPLLRVIVALHCLVWLKISQVVSGLSLPVGLKVGRGLLISHPGSIIINSQAIIGENCNIAPGVVIGFGIIAGSQGYPTIGDRVFIGPGAKIFGPISIGNDVMIGANAVVNRPVPDNAVVVGVPARVVSRKGSSEYVKY